VDPTAVLDIVLPCHTSILPTDRRAVLHVIAKLVLGQKTQGRVGIEQCMAGLGLSNVRQCWDRAA